MKTYHRGREIQRQDSGSTLFARPEEDANMQEYPWKGGRRLHRPIGDQWPAHVDIMVETRTKFPASIRMRYAITPRGITGDCSNWPAAVREWWIGYAVRITFFLGRNATWDVFSVADFVWIERGAK